MDANSDYLIIKQKLWSKDTHKYDVHIAESLINQGLLTNVCYIMTGLPKWYQLLRERHFLIAIYKGCLPKWNY